MSWDGCYEPRKATFRALAGQPEVVWPKRGFVATAMGGHGTDCLGDRGDVLARDNPPWAEAVLRAAVEAGMPLIARRVGSAGTYTFWRLCAASPAQAEADGRRLRAERDAELAQRERDALVRNHALPVGHRLVDPTGAVIPTTAASLQWRGHRGLQRMLLADGSVVPVPADAVLHDSAGVEVHPYRAATAGWLPRPERLNADPAGAVEWLDLLREQEEPPPPPSPSRPAQPQSATRPAKPQPAPAPAPENALAAALRRSGARV